jgi:hypothetical protein
MQTDAFANIYLRPVGPDMEAVEEVTAANDRGVDKGASQRHKARQVCPLAEPFNKGIEDRDLRNNAEVVAYLDPSLTAVAAERRRHTLLIVGQGRIVEFKVALIHTAIATGSEMV